MQIENGKVSQKTMFSSCITHVLLEHGWTAFGGPALATKKFETAAGQREASAWLQDYGENSASYMLSGEYTSEGRNCLDSYSVLIPKDADLEIVRKLAGKFSTQADVVVANTYAARLHAQFNKL